jgi:hypothetical protein
MYDALAEMLSAEYDIDAATVTGFEDYTASSGYCDTCYSESARCKIFYVDSNGSSDEYDYYGSFSEMMRSL